MRLVLAASVALALWAIPAAAQRLADEPVLDPSKLPTYHGVSEWTLGCSDSNMLLRIKSELGGQPVRVETHARMAELHCSIIPKSEPVKFWNEYTYVGLSGSMHGPHLARIISGRGIILFVMRDEIAR